MNLLAKNIIALLLIGLSLPVMGQKEWVGRLALSDFDCDNQTACYTLSLKGLDSDSWALGNQNYRFFFDAANISIVNVKSLLPADLYSAVQTDEILEIVGQNQETFSPLDHIDTHLGFLDFNIISYANQFPHLAKQVNKETFLPIAEICLEVSATMMDNEGEASAMNILFSRATTAGQITNQYSVISEIDAPNHTRSTQPAGFLDVNYNAGLDAQLGQLCQLMDKTEISELMVKRRLTLYPNPYSFGERLTYESELINPLEHEVFIYDGNARLVKHYQSLPAGNQSIKIEEELPSGVYLFHLKSKEHQMTQEFVIN